MQLAPSLDLSGFARVRLAQLPTPLDPLPRLSAHLGGPEIFIKRDDCTGLAFGGNKTRKLEFILGDALARGVQTIITEGPLQSNHVRQTLAACNRLGLACELVLSRQSRWTDAGDVLSGNRLLLDLLGARVTMVETEQDRPDEMRRIEARILREGGSACIVPTGGSTPLGGLGYANCAEELGHQVRELRIVPDAIVLSAGSGGTQGGLIAGLCALDSDIEVAGIDIDAEPEVVAAHTLNCAKRTAELLDVEVPRARVKVLGGYAGPAYGVPTSGMADAVRLLAELEGILLDPIYTGKAMAGLIGQIGQGRWERGQQVIFLHTGGTPAIFSYAPAFSRDRRAAQE